ncbi:MULTISPECIES: helix-turn-helix transcriptional regulator [Bacillus]|uniref:DeoR faimly transcriptional regulator n=2 Tax=Bacillus TaxID=1386 RepID=A0A0M4GBL0_9BACI|nr:MULTISPECIES: YafY family protein [Bacillus]ALC83140.1 DeoR faimly transcriptional regulator [Bacillus gobiensis]MBP1082207.1 putative DNA-binding transcriptional regulator YafY [Bacillus capparidis]MED1096821.1 YafY family protein [Bacillus capparidis]
MSKADNMLSILWMLKERKRVTAKQIANALEINIRTVYRYIDALCASGVPIIADSGHNGGYSLLHDFTDIPLFFDTNEQKALIHAAAFAKEAGYPFGESLQQAISKLKKYTNPEQLNKIHRHEEGFEVITAPVDPSLEAVLQELELSAADGYTLRMEYQTKNEESIKIRHIDPYGLVHWKNSWYSVAYCHLREDIRTFRVDRIQGLSRTDAEFERPKDFSARTFFLKNLLPDPENKEQLIPIRIQGNQPAINDLASHWLFGHMIIERSEHMICFVLEKDMAVHYAPFILLSYGKSIQVLEPQLVKEKLIEAASELLTYYQTLELH